MKEREFWRERASGRVYAIEFEDGIVTGSCGPLTASETEERFLNAFDYSVSEAGWLEANRELFDLYRNGAQRGRAQRVAERRHSSGRDSPLSATTVADAMHRGIISCSPRASLREVAKIMASHGVHAVVVWGDEEEDAEGIWGLVSDLDLVVAAAEGAPHARSAVGVAGTPVVSVQPSDTMIHAAEVMGRNRVTHLVVVSEDGARPVGIVSTLDVARALANLDRPAGT